MIRTAVAAVVLAFGVWMIISASGTPAARAASTDSNTLFLGVTSSDTGAWSAADIIFVTGQSEQASSRKHFYFLKNVLSGSPYHHLETGYAYIGNGFYAWFSELWGWSVSTVSCPQELPRSGYHVDISPTIRQCWGLSSDGFLGPDGTAHYYRHINAFGQWGAQACGATNPGGSSDGCMNIGQVPTGGYDSPTETTVLFESNGTAGPVDTSDIIKGNFFSLERWNAGLSAFVEVTSGTAVVTGFYVGGAGYRGWPAAPHTVLCPPWGIAPNVFGNYHWVVVGNWTNTSCVADGTTLW